MSAFNREFLTNLNLPKETIDSIMDVHGKTIEEFKGNKAKLDEVNLALAQEKTTNQGLSDKFNSLFTATQELVQANQTLLEEQKKYQAEKTQAALQKAHEAAVEKSVNSLDDSYDKTFFKNYFKNAEIDENGEIKNFKEEMDKFRNAYKPRITGGYKHIEGTATADLQNTAGSKTEIYQKIKENKATVQEYHDNFWALKRQEYSNKT